MESAFHCNDLLLLINCRKESIRASDVMVFRTEDRGIPIVHLQTIFFCRLHSLEIMVMCNYTS
jgi:hypothetical protein